MNILNSYNNTIKNIMRPINNYSSYNFLNQFNMISYNNDSNKVYKDIESQEYYIDNKNYSYQYKNLSFSKYENIEEPKNNYSELPIGTGYYDSGSLVWTRPSKFSDYHIYWKGIEYKLNYKDLQLIASKIKKINFESIIKIYIENNMDPNATICHFIV